MKNFSQELEIIANSILCQTGEKPNYSNLDFLNTVIIFQYLLMDKMYDTMEYDKMDIDDRLKMAESCGSELRKLIHTFTGLDTHKLEDFL